MIQVLLCMMLFQAAAPAASQPVIDNDRVSVVDVNNVSVAAQPNDAVVVSLSGIATFVPKGSRANLSGRMFLINLKDHPVPPIENKSGYPLAFPRPGTTKVFEK